MSTTNLRALASRALLYGLIPFSVLTHFAGGTGMNGQANPYLLDLQTAALHGGIYAVVLAGKLWARLQRLHVLLWTAAAFAFALTAFTAGAFAQSGLNYHLTGTPLPDPSTLLRQHIKSSLILSAGITLASLIPLHPKSTEGQLPPLPGTLTPAAIAAALLALLLTATLGVMPLLAFLYIVCGLATLGVLVVVAAEFLLLLSPFHFTHAPPHHSDRPPAA